MKDFLKNKDKFKSKIYFDYNIGKLTWFRTGGNAKIFIIIENNKELEIILNEIRDYNHYVIGAGSNLLIRDKGFDGIILKLGKEFNNFKIDNNNLIVGSSILDINLSNYAMRNNIEGFEFFSGIPGTLGGAVKMNAGCFGNETKDILNSIEVYKNFEKKIIMKDDLNISYI